MAVQGPDESPREEYPQIKCNVSTVPAAPKFSFGTRFADANKGVTNDTPGPGSYYDNNSDASARYKRMPKFSFGAGTREEMRKPKAPGPGQYMARKAFGGEGPNFSLTPRRASTAGAGSRRQKAPGPGSHELPSLLGSDGPQATMTPRRPDPVARTQPGPGDYRTCNPSSLLSGRGGGAGASVPQYGFGTAAQRPKGPLHAAEPSPGPGAYRHEVRKIGSGPQFSMRPRTANDKELFVK